MRTPPKRKKPMGPPARRGAVMVTVLLITMITMLVGLAAMIVSSTDLKITWNYKRGAQAFYAAESGVQRAIAELREDNDWTDGFAETAQNNGTQYEVAFSSISESLGMISATGRAGASKRRIEVIVNIDSAFDHALNIGGDLVMAGKPKISSEGVRLNGDAYFDWDNGTTPINLYAPTTSTLTYAEGSNELPVNRIDAEPLDIKAARLTDDDWNRLANQAASSYFFDNDGITGSRDVSITINNLDFNDVPPNAEGKRTIYVDGDLTLNGTISGVGTIVSTGKITGTGGFVANGNPTVSFVAKDDVLLNFDTNNQSNLNGLTYTEGDYRMYGKIHYTGVVTSFGGATIQNPSEFTNNNDPAYWYTYSAAYAIVSDPIDILAWQEVTA
ncbi:MAG: pilus assembly PilX N-terminal domain-containing protein [Deltaproteobacteria bacterium]|nr:pilus assembly PilX N-terminal domain-containing protein [Deltaproteobacteria bacterium]